MAWIVLLIGTAFTLVGLRKMTQRELRAGVGMLGVGLVLSLAAAFVRIQTHGWLQ